MSERILLGGYFFENIKNWIMDECFQTDDPETFFEAILEVIYEMDDNRSWLDQ